MINSSFFVRHTGGVKYSFLNALHLEILNDEKDKIIIGMDDIDKKILNILQKEFPLEERPFYAIAEKCGH